MKIRRLSVFPLVLTVVILESYASPTPKTSGYEVPRTEYGLPDLRGVWNFSSNTPMQRDARFGEQEFLTPEERQVAAPKPPVNPISSSKGDKTNNWISYNDFWTESTPVGNQVRTSHIIHPKDGRLPEIVKGAIVQHRGRFDVPGTRPVRYVLSGIAKDGPEDRGLSSRCLVGFNSGPPFVPSLYNNNVQIFQNKDTAVIMTEMIHDARIIPLNKSKDLHDDIRLWSGDSRGWWDGDTLVVETKNFNGLRDTFYPYGSNRDVLLTERFTRVAHDTIEYVFTINDPSTFKDVITAVIPMTKIDGLLYEFACHEGNYSMTNILRGERELERRRAETARIEENI
ncbi:hypothetical protein N8373_02690 [Gammaproteobacteria bacterium]|jgi:hypothetical protein|nr:hypothetical protein [Gammaproteobacteria bacterium]MDB2504424.1 hypothetical protein [Gammaproteobacteria bacterium]MDB4003101.1 hypothetical protein [Gammaproteobacteria bacterium]MDC1358616.1 hypothetical protein [Gammaproteobacteria bacterium]MDC1391215.1 hypothetical protein [Gammaproteobacteria bacterium]